MFRRGVLSFGLLAWAALSHAASPLTPEQERATFRLADLRLTVELVAAEPDVRAPVALAWDAAGRMFVAEMTDYPSGPVNGRIRLLEDHDRDGRFERVTMFATNLAFPNGVMPWKNGVLVTAAPDIWFLADTNGDGMADVRERILTGFSEGNQQLRVNGLFWGIDNWIYGANGRSDGEAKWADGAPAGSIRRRDFRFRPDRRVFESIAGNSQFGTAHDDWGNRFPVFNNIPIRHVAMEDRFAARVPGLDNVPAISPATDGNRVFAVTPPNLLIPQPVGFFTSACGPAIYRGGALPGEYDGNYFVCEPVQNVVQRRSLQPDGASFLAAYAHTNAEFLASIDPWFHGVFTATGPDGALYIVDFYRDLVEHPHWVAPELRDKVNWRKGEEHGRIWRIRRKLVSASPAPALSAAPAASLVEALESGNGWTRDTAQRLLIERDAREMLAALEKLAHLGATPQARLHALRTIEGLNCLTSAVIAMALGDPSPRVRECAVELAGDYLAPGSRARFRDELEPKVNGNGLTTLQERLAVRLAPMADDPDARVRMRLALVVAEWPPGLNRAPLLAHLAQHRELDRWQAASILAGVVKDPWPLGERLRPLLAGGTEAQVQLLERLAAFVAAGGRTNDHAPLIAWLSGSTAPARWRVLAAFLEAKPAGQISLGPFRAPVLAAVADASLSADDRVAAIRCFTRIEGTAEHERLAGLLKAEVPESVQTAAAKALLESRATNGAALAIARWADCPKAVRRQMLSAAVRSPRGATALLDAVEARQIASHEIDPTLRQTLEKSADATVKKRTAQLLAAAVSSDRAAVIETFRPALKLAGDRARGAATFERLCLACHPMQGVGTPVGPDLSGIGTQSRESLLMHMLDPSRQVLPDFVSYTAVQKDGEVFSGCVVAETPASVTLRRPNEPDLTLPRDQIKELRTEGRSLMPDGLEAGMTPQDMADLVEFLRLPDRTLFGGAKKQVL
jgi:putative membrane-bound dehydrogenase-like protein